MGRLCALVFDVWRRWPSSQSINKTMLFCCCLRFRCFGNDGMCWARLKSDNKKSSKWAWCSIHHKNSIRNVGPILNANLTMSLTFCIQVDSLHSVQISVMIQRPQSFILLHRLRRLYWPGRKFSSTQWFRNPLPCLLVARASTPCHPSASTDGGMSCFWKALTRSDTIFFSPITPPRTQTCGHLPARCAQKQGPLATWEEEERLHILY